MDPTLVVIACAIGAGVAGAGAYAARRIERLAVRLGRAEARAAHAERELERTHAFAKHLGARPPDPADYDRLLEYAVAGAADPARGVLGPAVPGGAAGAARAARPRDVEPHGAVLDRGVDQGVDGPVRGAAAPGAAGPGTGA